MGRRVPVGARRSKSLEVLLGLTVLLGGLPFVLYAWERATGALPGAAEWMLRGINHGPWRWELEGVTVGLPLLLLAAVTLLWTAGLALRRRRPSLFGSGLLLIGCQALLLIAQLRVLFWTID